MVLCLSLIICLQLTSSCQFVTETEFMKVFAKYHGCDSIIIHDQPIKPHIYSEIAKTLPSTRFARFPFSIYKELIN
jgi:hypothetical protein